MDSFWMSCSCWWSCTGCCDSLAFPYYLLGWNGWWLVRAMRWFNGCGSRVARLKRPWHPDCMLCVCGYNRNNAPSPLRVDKHSQRHSSRLAFVFIPVLFVFELHSLQQWITVCTAASRCLSLTVWLHCAANNGTWSGPNIQISNWWRSWWWCAMIRIVWVTFSILV